MYADIRSSNQSPSGNALDVQDDQCDPDIMQKTPKRSENADGQVSGPEIKRAKRETCIQEKHEFQQSRTQARQQLDQNLMQKSQAIRSQLQRPTFPNSLTSHRFLKKK